MSAWPALRMRRTRINPYTGRHELLDEFASKGARGRRALPEGCTQTSSTSAPTACRKTRSNQPRGAGASGTAPPSSIAAERPSLPKAAMMTWKSPSKASRVASSASWMLERTKPFTAAKPPSIASTMLSMSVLSDFSVAVASSKRSVARRFAKFMATSGLAWPRLSTPEAVQSCRPAKLACAVLVRVSVVTTSKRHQDLVRAAASSSSTIAVPSHDGLLSAR
mmetsp:Transcript_43944/g.133082  ORF Transcript_43944/g.133082 Transcript_43944/m.133082 type:complete len:222 (-) Transcript_43944:886-1551(-)